MTEFQATDSKTDMTGTVITIDGPAGAGKSTVARMLADRLGFEFLDTGALYRCVTLAFLRSRLNAADEARVAELAARLQIEFDGERILLDGEDVSAEIRSPEVSTSIGLIANNLEVRQILTAHQRAWTRGKCVVSEGRDQGSEVFSDSRCKIFLEASAEERALRRQRELAEKGLDISYEQVLDQQQKRDAEDSSRPVGALHKTADAFPICTDGLALEAVVDRLMEVVRERLGFCSYQPTDSTSGVPAEGPSLPDAGQGSALSPESRP